jgi:glycosyltransferase involved in cell wall biosynthesis
MTPAISPSGAAGSLRALFGELRPSEVVLVIPCYNEAARLPIQAFSSFLENSPDVAFVFVNDGSRDDTSSVVAGLVLAYPGRVALLDQAVNLGKGEAVRQGLLAALSLNPFPTQVGFWDADLATPLDAVASFQEVLQTRPECDWVMGARVKLLGRHIERKKLRHYLGRVFATAASITLGLAVYDTQCGAKLFRANALLRSALKEPFASRWIFDVELIGRYMNLLVAAGCSDPAAKFYELPLDTWVDVRGSKVSASDFLRASVDLARIWWRLRRGRRRLGVIPPPEGGMSTLPRP